ncbi:MAG: TetR/AcrR family transcriptional regulator [Thermodesulfobacteriota bacterium]|nr:TetR/AcrR family transcriptional regulator [Thermodesulfobacteriota bacterium]
MQDKSHFRPRKIPTQDRARVTVDAIYEGALLLFTRDGYDAVTTDKIAERAGVSIGTLYQYFPNKESILIGLWEQVFDAVVIGGTTHSLSTPRSKTGSPGYRANSKTPDVLMLTPGNLTAGITGVYRGKLSGAALCTIFNIGHEFRFRGEWVCNVGEEDLSVEIKKLPVFDKIIGSGKINPQSGKFHMTFKLAFFRKLECAGELNSDGRFFCHIPRVDLSLSCQLDGIGGVTGTWKLDFSFVLVKVAAQGRMSGAIDQ